MLLPLLPKGRRAWIRAGLVLGIPVVLAGIAWLVMIRMPGRSHEGPLPPMTEAQAALRDRLRARVERLASGIGPRGLHAPGSLGKSASLIEEWFREVGLAARRLPYEAAGETVANLEAEIPGGARAGEILVVGAHYDTDGGCPGANDNGSGVAALLEIAGALRGRRPARTVRFVAFVNEEPPFFQREGMGSLAYARGCREREEAVAGMISLETIGYYADGQVTQKYPFPFQHFYPSTGNFITFVGNVDSRSLVHDAVASFRRHARFPSEGAAVPGWIPGIGLSDHWSFWQSGFPALMVTDTAPFRYEHYHSGGDTPDRLDYGRTARVVEGLAAVVKDLADPR